MGIDSGRPVFALPDGVQVEEDGFDVFLVLEEEGVFDGLPDAVHLLQTHLLLLLIQSVLVQVLYQLTTQSYVLRYLLIVLLTLVRQADLVGHANAFEISNEITEVYVSGDEVALHI